jgi:predicted metal-dependent phosphoesterase TrpH
MTRPLRVVMHAHSTWSYDGRLPLDRIARLYGRLGADAVMMTEHDTGFDPSRFPEYRAACAAASTARCTLVPGIEYSSPDNDIHILTWGLDRFLAEHRPVNETLQQVRALGGVSVLAHPVRRKAWQRVEPGWFPLLDGIELWNRKSDGLSWGTEALALIAQSGLPASVGHDFHRLRQIWPLHQRFDRPRAEQGLEAALVAAIQQGLSQPMAFGRPLLDGGSIPRPWVFPALEQMRRGLLNTIVRTRR